MNFSLNVEIANSVPAGNEHDGTHKSLKRQILKSLRKDWWWTSKAREMEKVFAAKNSSALYQLIRPTGHGKEVTEACIRHVLVRSAARKTLSTLGSGLFESHDDLGGRVQGATVIVNGFEAINCLYKSLWIPTIRVTSFLRPKEGYLQRATEETPSGKYFAMLSIVSFRILRWDLSGRNALKGFFRVRDHGHCLVKRSLVGGFKSLDKGLATLDANITIPTLNLLPRTEKSGECCVALRSAIITPLTFKSVEQVLKFPSEVKKGSLWYKSSKTEDAMWKAGSIGSNREDGARVVELFEIVLTIHSNWTYLVEPLTVFTTAYVVQSFTGKTELNENFQSFDLALTTGPIDDIKEECTENLQEQTAIRNFTASLN
ncbi:hypothetical protein CLF_101085 [Clonorchis sinensis]|uniref:Uncharacterized protein n=1 Tax=Clonorchis sinensis TaxID=79923 RepID=G7Y4Z1_CLOSI|nr:hypothetical protein CLF_101085 [Clonorchis sinensis]